MSSATDSDTEVPHAVGAPAAGVWGDETEIAAAAVAPDLGHGSTPKRPNRVLTR